ncbi:hypothetical protein MTO96_039909, partial [Rhipicephalus appendiculatus]
EAQEQSHPTTGVNNVLGLGSPFVDADEDPLSDTASIALSFLSPESSSSSEVTQPRTDIYSAVLRAADAVEGEDVTSKELVEDARLVELFVATALEDASLSDGAPPPLPLNEAERAAHEEERVARMVEERRVHTTLSRLRSSSPRWKVQPSSQTSLKRLSPTAAQRGAGIASPDGRAGEVREEESTSSSTDIENLAEILTSLKVTQLDSSHHRAERTLKREYSVVMKRSAQATPASLLAGALSTSQLRPTRPALRTATANDVPGCLEEAGSAKQTERTAEMAPMQVVPMRFSAVEPANVAVAMPELPALDDSAGKRASEECVSSELGPPVATPSSSNDDTADAKASSRPDSEPRRLSFLAELHRARTANSRLVPPAALTFRPGASEEVNPLPQDHLEPTAEVLHSVEMQAPPLPLRTKGPFFGEGEALHSASAKRKDTPVAPDGEAQQAEASTGIVRGSHSMKRLSPRLHIPEGCAVSEERGAPSRVRSEPPLPRSPFAMMKHVAKARSDFHAAISPDVGGSRSGGKSRLNETTLSAASAVSPFCGGIDGGANDAKACTSSSIPTATETTDKAEGRDELMSLIPGSASFVLLVSLLVGRRYVGTYAVG